MQILLVFGLITLPQPQMNAQRPPDPPFINVSGSAEIKVTPDEVNLSVGVETRHERLEEAKRLNDQRVSKALEFLKHSGVKLTNMGSFDRMLSGLITNGVNRVHLIDFRTTQLCQYKDQVRAMAIRAAKEKAEAIAFELGIQVGKPHSVTVDDSSARLGWMPQTPWGYGGFGGGGIGGVDTPGDEDGLANGTSRISISHQSQSEAHQGVGAYLDRFSNSTDGK